MKFRFPKFLAVAAALALLFAACGSDDDSEPAASGSPSVVDDGDMADDTADDMADGPSVKITSPADGAEVTSPVTITMEATNFTIDPAGEVVDGHGHFHLMVDVGCVTPGEVIPSDTEGYNHFGKAQLETELELTPGEHTLCLQVGDGVHTALDITDTITITVVE